LKNLNKKI